MEILNDNQPTVLHSVDAMAVVDLVIACDGGVAVWLCGCVNAMATTMYAVVDG